MLTVHAAVDNQTPDVLRLSVDFRYTGSSHVIGDDRLLPHGNIGGERFTWETLEREWKDSPVAHYWERWRNVRARPIELFWETGHSR